MSTCPACVSTTLNYYVTPENGGTEYIYPATASNYTRVHDTQPASITDLRSVEGECPAVLDVQGFQLVQHSCSEQDWTDPSRVKDVAYKENVELLKKVTGATRVHIVSHLVRRQRWEAAQAMSKGLKDDELVPLASYATNRYVHIDQSTAGAEALLREELPSPDEAERLGKGRWGIINIWRPISNPVRREPLAVCDLRTVSPADLHQVTLQITPTEVLNDIVTSGRLLTWAVTANPAHRWYFVKEMTPDEVLMIKIYDSVGAEGTIRGTPHCAFVTEGDEGPARESVEMRCLVFWEDQ